MVPPEVAEISIHAPREGGDGRPGRAGVPVLYFNPRPPRGGRLQPDDCPGQGERISIHAPREGGDETGQLDAIVKGISIHAPREGGDQTAREKTRTA